MKTKEIEEKKLNKKKKKKLNEENKLRAKVREKG